VRVDDPLAGLDVGGAVQAEVFVLRLREGAIELTGPCGAAPWYMETAPDEHPVDVVRRIVEGAIGPPLLVHSTSWRHGDRGVVLSFIAVIADADDGMESVPVGRVALARSGATAAPASIDVTQVLEHAVRHLAWLAEDDDDVAARLSDGWRTALAAYVPEPFRNLG
jgi:hypothetical protein